MSGLLGDVRGRMRRSNRRRGPLSLRRRAAVLALALLAGFALGLGVGEPWLGALAPEEVRVHALSVAGPTRVPSGELVASAGLEPGVPLPAVDLEAVRETLLRHPWIRDARVAALPPNRVLVSVDERKPVAVAVLADGRRLLVDESGTAFDDAPEGVRLPELRGAEHLELLQPDPLLAQGVRLLEAVATRGIQPAPSQVWLGGDAPERLPALCWEAPRSAPLRAVLGGGEVDPKLARLARLLSAQLAEVDRADEIDLRFGERVVLRGAAPGAAPGSDARAPHAGVRTRGG